MNDNGHKIIIGKDSVVIGNISGNIGDRSVFIGATDQFGNTFINQPMAVGNNAMAGPNSIAIGANARAGSDVFILLTQLKEICDNNNHNTETSKNISELIIELKKEHPDSSVVNKIWSSVKNMSTVNGAISLISNISVLIGQHIK